MMLLVGGIIGFVVGALLGFVVATLFAASSDNTRR